MEVSCIICYKNLESLEGTVQPIGGTAFGTYGHYGSGEFDPANGTQLQIVICDGCLSLRRRYALVLTTRTKTYTEAQPWR